jgi:hypothetical protein
MRRMGLVMILGAFVGFPALAAGGRDQNPPAEARIIPYSGVLPACGDPFVLADITRDFVDRESEYWRSGLAILAFDEIRETGYRTNGASYIPRRYCSAKADFNDGQRRRVGYEIGEQTGFIGLGHGVTWCVVGLDRNHAFSPDCRAAGP